MAEETEMLIIGGPSSGQNHRPAPGAKYLRVLVRPPGEAVREEVGPTSRSAFFTYKRFRIHAPTRWDTFEVWIPADVVDQLAPHYVCRCAAVGPENVDPSKYGLEGWAEYQSRANRRD